ncbi:MAG: hypothetical protein ACXVIJ_13840 [Thermoanaerobaculia bacterium]
MAPPTSAATHETPLEEDIVPDGRIGRTELTILGIGLAIAIVAHVLPFTRFIFSALISLLHELGHAIMAWLLGHPAIPAFDFVYGGGFTNMGAFHITIAIAIAAAIAYAMWLFRRNPMTLVVLAVIALIWLVLVSNDWRRETAIFAAGHLAEIIFAAIFFYMALSGVGWRMPEIERPLGAFVAFFVQMQTMTFAWRLFHDPDALAVYREGKGGALMNDLEVVALNLHIHLGINTSIEGMAKLLFLFSFVPIPIAIVWYLYRSRWHRLGHALLRYE